MTGTRAQLSRRALLTVIDEVKTDCWSLLTDAPTTPGNAPVSQWELSVCFWSRGIYFIICPVLMFQDVKAKLNLGLTVSYFIQFVMHPTTPSCLSVMVHSSRMHWIDQNWQTFIMLQTVWAFFWSKNPSK